MVLYEKKKSQIVALIFFSAFVLIGSYVVSISQCWVYTGLFNHTQAWMVLASPFIALYDNRKGKNMKNSYIYIIPHISVFFIDWEICTLNKYWVDVKEKMKKYLK